MQFDELNHQIDAKEIVSKKEYFEVLRFRNAMASFNTIKFE